MLVSSNLFISGFSWGLSRLPLRDPTKLGKLLGIREGCWPVWLLNMKREPWVKGCELRIMIGEVLVLFWGVLICS